MAFPTAINNEGRVVGTNVPIGGGLPEGFQRDPAGNEISYNFPGALGTVVFGISNDDTYSGFYVTSEGRRGFVEQPSSGLSRSVEFPGSAETQLFGINDLGQAGGAYYDAAGAAFPFIYDIASNSFEEITPPSSGNYVVTSINDAGDAIVFGLREASENYADLRSFYRDGQTGLMRELFYPGAVETYGYDIDNQGTIIGYYLDEDGDYGGFTATERGKIHCFGGKCVHRKTVKFLGNVCWDVTISALGDTPISMRLGITHMGGGPLYVERGPRGHRRR